MKRQESISNLRLRRVLLGRTQYDVARKARIAPSRLSILERNLSEASSSERADLARALGATQAELFEADHE